MTSIERTAYPRFGRVVTARELAALSPSPDEVALGTRLDPLGWSPSGVGDVVEVLPAVGLLPEVERGSRRRC